ncbi:MAG: hypothetical protein PVH91_03305 [Pseudomonadales bacterium]
MRIRCEHCGHWFDYPIGFGDGASFDPDTLVGNSVECPACYRLTECTEDRIRVHPPGHERAD